MKVLQAVEFHLQYQQATKRNRYAVLSAFYNFFINTSLPSLVNPCVNIIFKKIFRRPQIIGKKVNSRYTVNG